MVTTARRRDPRDGRTLRIVDESFWARERDMLSLRLSLLHDFLSSKGIYHLPFIHFFLRCAPSHSIAAHTRAPFFHPGSRDFTS
jgi:hypothetical protein